MILDITIQFLFYQNNVDCLKILYYSIETLAKRTKFAKKKRKSIFLILICIVKALIV